MLARLDDIWKRTPDHVALIEALAWIGPAMDQAASERLAAR
jgi:hypothetical protein